MEDDQQATAHISADQTEVKLAFKQRYTALELEALIYELAAVRANMLPPVPNATPNSDEGQISCFDGADITAARIEGDELALMIRHAGTGWLCFTLDLRNASALGRYLLASANSDDNPTLTTTESTNGPVH